jgi:hypothetical protein
VTILICRLGLECDRDFDSLPHLISATNRAVGVLDGLATFLECLKTDDFYSFWTQWSAYQLSNAVTLLLQQVIRVSQLEPECPSPDLNADRRSCLHGIFSLLRRIVVAMQFASEGGWEVAEAALPRIKSLIRSMPAIPGIELVQAAIVPTTAAPSSSADWIGKEVEPDADTLALFDWLNGDHDWLKDRVF